MIDGRGCGGEDGLLDHGQVGELPDHRGVGVQRRPDRREAAVDEQLPLLGQAGQVLDERDGRRLMPGERADRQVRAAERARPRAVEAGQRGDADLAVDLVARAWLARLAVDERPVVEEEQLARLEVGPGRLLLVAERGLRDPARRAARRRGSPSPPAPAASPPSPWCRRGERMDPPADWTRLGEVDGEPLVRGELAGVALQPVLRRDRLAPDPRAAPRSAAAASPALARMSLR